VSGVRQQLGGRGEEKGAILHARAVSYMRQEESADKLGLWGRAEKYPVGQSGLGDRGRGFCVHGTGNKTDVLMEKVGTLRRGTRRKSRGLNQPKYTSRALFEPGKPHANKGKTRPRRKGKKT